MVEQDSENKVKKSKEKDLYDSLELFGEDKDTFDLDEATEYQMKFPKELAENLLKTSRLVTIANLTIQGYEEKPGTKSDAVTYKRVKNPMASSEVIKGFQGILKTYADEANVVGKMTWEDYSIKVMSDWRAFFKLSLKDKASPQNFKRAVYRIFQGCVTNVGAIICDNPGNMSDLFKKIRMDGKDDDYRLGFGN